MNNVLYISQDYMKLDELKNIIYIKNDFDDETLGKIWRNYDFNKAEERVFELQCKLSKATMLRNKKRCRQLQDKIIYSSEAKMLAVRKVSEGSKVSAGVDKIVWRKDSDKMRACINLNTGIYKAQPLRQFRFKDKKSYKERQVGIPTMYDRAMQVLYAYSLEPIAEVTADRKSFAFRKGRSTEQVHAYIMDCLTDIDKPEWILISDVKSYYDTISHDWLLSHIPMKKHILYEFLKAGIMFNGEFFNKEEGISLGSNLSTILGNMTLDGLQKRLYDLQGEKITDYKNGYCLRFADDIFVTARTKEDAIIFKNEVIKFVGERGLRISENKTKIVNVKEGFDFLSRFYYKADGVVRCVPSQKSIDKFKIEIEELIFSNQKWSQIKLIQALNSKITGFATYHKCTECSDLFRSLDAFINAMLLKLMIELYPKLTKEQITKKFWKNDSLGRYIFSIPNNREKNVTIMADILQVKENKMDSSKNVFLDKEYFEELVNENEIQSCTGKYKKIWDKQEGKCFICSKEIRIEQPKELIFKRNSKDRTTRNMAYVHSFCKNSNLEYIEVEDDDINSINLREVLAEIEKKKTNSKGKESKFIKLKAYFHELRKNSVTLRFKDIERILGYELCTSAYKYKSYFTNGKKGNISESWISQGYEISNIDLENKKLSFKRIKFSRAKIHIPKFLYRTDLPTEMTEEINRFFLHIKEKYRV